VIVADASAVLEVLLGTPAGARVAARLGAPGESAHVPHLLDLEIAQVLRRWVRRRELDIRRAREALDDFADLPLFRYPHQPFLSRIWTLRDRLTAYDAAYVALAETLDAPLLTRDRRLAVAGHGATVEVV